MTRKFIWSALCLIGCLFVVAGCEKHSWQGKTEELFLHHGEEHHGGEKDHPKPEGDTKPHSEGEKANAHP